MADRSLTIKIGANVTGLVNGLKTADKAAQDWGNRTLGYVEKNSAQINSLANGLGLVGGALTGVAVLAVKTFADFDAAMSSVQASTMESAANMDLLRDAAIDAGSRTVYSATEAAGAIEELAKAGVSTADILGGGLDGALDLAASGAIGVSEAAEIAATAMTQFGLGGEDVTHIADLLAAGAGKAQGGVGDLGMALKQAGLVADQTGLSIEETTAGLTAFASAGLIGSDAGTSFKAMLQRLTPSSKEAETLMRELGISAYDAQGQFIGLAEFAQNLKDSLRDLTPEQRNAAMATIFGSDAVRAANVLYEEGAAGIDKWTAAVDDQGYAAEQAAIRMDNLKGDLEGLSGSFETALIGLGEGANGPLRSVVQALDGIVDGFNGLSDGAKQATLLLVGGGGLALLGVAGMAKLAIAVAETTTALKTMGLISSATAGRVGAVAASVGRFGGYALGIGAVAAGTGSLVDQLTRGEVVPRANALADAIERLGSSGDVAELNDQFSNFGTFLRMSVVDVNGLGDALAQAFRPSVTDQIAGFLDGFPGITGYMEKLEDRFTGLDQSLSSMVQGGSIDQARAAFEVIRAEAEAQGISIEELREKFPEYVDALVGAKDGTDEASTAMDVYSEAMAEGGATVDEYTAALEELISAQAEGAGVVMDLWSAQNQLEQAYADATQALADNGATLDVTTEKGRANREALIGISDAGWDVIASMRASGSTQAELQSQVQATRDRFIAAAQSMGMSADQANALADSLNLIPSAVNVDVAVDTDQAAGAMARFRAAQESVAIRIQARVDADPNYSPASSPVQIRRATGGPVYGPGTGTSDSVVARLSNGEHVLTASDVTKLGGHAAVYGLRAAIQSGRLNGYASGGAVLPSTQFAAPSYMSAPSVTVAPSSIGDIYVRDPFSGEYVRAQVASIARDEANHSIALAGRKSR
jgi:TP901 family phage tail tape measure protein